MTVGGRLEEVEVWRKQVHQRMLRRQRQMHQWQCVIFPAHPSKQPKNEIISPFAGLSEPSKIHFMLTTPGMEIDIIEEVVGRLEHAAKETSNSYTKVSIRFLA